MTAARVSVIMATYNHAPFVGEAVASVLAQKDVDLEFLVADDGSRDATARVVEGFRDPRIAFVAHPENRGACMVTNELIRAASGEYVALMNSDDIWLGDDKLACQVARLDADPSLGATFGRPRFIDSGGRHLPASRVPCGDVFDQPNRSRGGWLRRFFDEGNCLCHPTMLIRRECYDAVGLYDNRLRQLPDFDMWVRLVNHFDIHVSERELIAFRHLPGENASAVTATNSRRAVFELYFILRRFFDGTPRDVLREGFHDVLIHPELPTEVHADIEKAFLYTAEQGQGLYIRGLIALEKLHDLMGSEAHRTVLREDYDFDDNAFHTLTGGHGALDSATSDVLEREVRDLNATLRAVESSVSWRVTAPLRRIGRLRARRG